MTIPVETRRELIRSRRQRKKSARRARYRRRLVRYALLFSLLAAGWSGFSKLPWSLHDAESDLIVHGNEVASTQQIRNAINISNKQPLYKINPRQIEKQIVALPAVKNAFVRRYALPHPRLIVEVLEEFPWATFALNPESQPLAVIAQSGRQIPIKDFPHIPQPPLLIYGQQNLKLTGADVSQWARWTAFITKQTGQPVQFVDMRIPYDVRVQNGDLSLKLGQPDATLTRRLGRLTSVLTAIEPLKGRLQYIDLSLDNNIPLKVAKKDIVRDRTATAASSHSI
jgi:cell division septal protein FtsQ